MRYKCEIFGWTQGVRSICVWEWALEYLGRSWQSGPFSTYGGLGQNLIGEHTIFRAVFQKRTAYVL